MKAELRKLSAKEAREFIIEYNLADCSWVEYAGVCLIGGIDYNCRVLTRMLKKITGRDFYIVTGLTEDNECTDVFNAIEKHLSDDPTETEIYEACASEQHRSDEAEHWYDIFALILCNEYGIEFDRKKFDLIFEDDKWKQ